MTSHRVFLAAIVGLALAQAGDALTMAGAIAGGVSLAAEANPLARLAFGGFGVLGMLAPKLLTAAVIGALALLVWQDHPRSAMTLVLVGVAIGLLGAAMNVAAYMAVA
jgi:hypothetical protein